jgi:sulfur relay (sulfurtransferase) complex TusBCD TusD component (DsrE family)
MRFCFLINPTDHWQQAIKHAFYLAQQANINQELIGVFFYGSSVHIIQDSQLQTQWHDLADCPLYVCRTMVDEYQLAEKDIEAPFQLIGMAPWVMIMEQADRIVEIT